MDSRAMAFKPAFKKTSAEINQVYAREGRSVGVYLGYYRHQNYAQKLVSSNNVLVASNDPHWSLVVDDHRGVSWAEQSVDVRSAELRGTTLKEAVSSERLLAWQIYWVDGQLTSSDHMAKILGVFARLRGHGDDAAVMVIYTPKERTGDADATLLSYWRDNYPMLHALLRTAQQSR
jgi:EpsI family protein